MPLYSLYHSFAPARPSRLRRGRLLLACLASLLLVLGPNPAAAQNADPPGWSGRLYLPSLSRSDIYRCPATSTAHYDALPYAGVPTDRPAELHADLNLALRGYAPVAAPLALVWYGGATDALAPQLPGLFADGRVPVFASAYQVFDWNWDPTCGPHGCRGPLLSDWPATLLGLATVRGEAVRPPGRGAALYPGGYVALVLYAAESRITLKYTREDNVVSGYAVHIEDVCVDPALLTLYRALDAAGRPALPALRDGETLGVATGKPLLVAVRDNGQFMDPRSAKDWWQTAQIAGRLLPSQIYSARTHSVGPLRP